MKGVPAGGTGNRGEDADRRAEKLARLDRTYRAVRDGASVGVQGFGEADWRCLACGAINRGPITTAGMSVISCYGRCRGAQLHERFRGEE